MRDTPLIFWRLYRILRRHNLGRRASLRQAWRHIAHRFR